jgi:hypothetical protein
VYSANRIHLCRYVIHGVIEIWLLNVVRPTNVL